MWHEILPSYNHGQNIWNKIEKSSKIGTRKVCNLLLRVFWLLLPKFKLWKGDWALGYVSTQIWAFSNISLFPKILNLKIKVNRIPSWLYQISRFVLVVVNPICLEHCKVPKYYDQDCSWELQHWGSEFSCGRMKYLFVYQFWYWELCVENLLGGERKHYFVGFFPAGVLLMLLDEGWCGLFYTRVCGHKSHALTVYLHPTFTAPPKGGAFGIQSNICGRVFLWK